jgi:hypothetical protein
MAAVGYILAFSIVMYRFFYMMRSLFHTIYDPGKPVWRKLTLTGENFWGNATKFLLDTSMTGACLVFSRIMIAGTASALVGAFIGLALSASVTGAPMYRDYVREQYQGT